MVDIYNKFFCLLRLAIGSSDVLPIIEKEEWRVIYKMAQKQSLHGVVFDGIQKMSDIVKMQGGSMEMNVDLLMTWIGKCKQIEIRNHQLDEAVQKISAWFQKKGFRSCILKGQGNALMYPHPEHRTPGDIDLWVSGKPGDVIRFVHSVAPKEKASYHHIDFPAVNDIPVEVHYRPCYLQNLLHNHRLQRYFRERAEEQFMHKACIKDAEVAIPTVRFNVVYQLVHIYNHLFQEGVGLRQIVDYYFVVEMWHAELTDAADEVAMQNDLKHLGLWSFCGAVMYVLHEVLGLAEEKMVAPMDAKRGKSLLDEILSSGNFGHYDDRFSFGRGAVGHNIQRFYRDCRLVGYFPAEALSEPIFRIWHFLWRMRNKK